MGATRARRAAEPLRPTRPEQRPPTLRFGPVLRQKRRHRQALLKLHLIHRHDSTLRIDLRGTIGSAYLKSRDQRLRFGANHVGI